MSDLDSAASRRGFLRKAITTGATVAGAALGGAQLFAADHGDIVAANGPTPSDIKILMAAEIAEALAVTTYTNIIRKAPFFSRLEDDDQGYLKAARQEEMSHYLLEQSVTGEPSPFTTFFYPFEMFENAQVTLNTLVTLEDAFIAAYLVGVRQFSNADGTHLGHRERSSYAGAGCRSRCRPYRWRPDRVHHRRTASGRIRRSTKQ
jgi:hypothetical protein